MFLIIGIVVVFGAVVAGYLMEHGNLRVLIQPAELVIIGGATIDADSWSAGRSGDPSARLRRSAFAEKEFAA
jgi:hypothetical protein